MTKKYVVVDAQFHHIPWEAAKKTEISKVEPYEGIDLRTQLYRPNMALHRLFDIETTIRHMDDCGVDVGLVGLATWNDAGLEVCKAINDGLAQLVREYPGRFIPLAHVPYLEGQPSIDELERAINYLGLKGVTFLTSHRGIRLDDQQVKAFFKKISQLSIPVVVHPTVRAPIWGGDKYYMSGSVSREYEIIKSFVEVLLGVLPKFPDLNFIFAHYGGGVPFLLGRIMSWYKPESTDIPDSPGLPKTIREFEDLKLKRDFNKLFDQMYFDMAGAGGWMPTVKQALLSIRPERLCFATDYPFEMGRPADLKAYIAGIKRLAIPEEDKIKILGDNVLRLFKA